MNTGFAWLDVVLGNAGPILGLVDDAWYTDQERAKDDADKLSAQAKLEAAKSAKDVAQIRADAQAAQTRTVVTYVLVLAGLGIAGFFAAKALG